MSVSQIYESLTEIFQTVFDDDSLAATPELTAGDIDEWDSLSNLRLMLTVEKHFNIKFSAAEIGKLKNVGELAALIEAKL
ncbi:MAG: acyl carrier protein [Methylococcales bacterium]|nr:acyl carrier protein [Methylococcales bacterium]